MTIFFSETKTVRQQTFLRVIMQQTRGGVVRKVQQVAIFDRQGLKVEVNLFKTDFNTDS